MRQSLSPTASAVRRPVAVLMGCAGVLLLGSVSFRGLPVDLLPDVETPRITLVTNAAALALAPPEVERLITIHLESQIATVSGQRRITSVSREGLSLITVEFPWGTDLDLAALHVREAIDKVREILPEGLERPAVLRWDPGSEPVLGIAVAGRDGAGALREMVETIVVPRLEQVSGIAGAQVTGGAQREIHVTLDANRLALFGLTVADVESALESANASLQSGNLLQGALRYQVRAMGEFRTVEEIGETILGRNPDDTRVRLSDVGQVEESTRPRTAGAMLDGQEAVGVLLHKEAGSNTVEAVSAAQEALAELSAQFPELSIAVAFENASFISEAIDSVVQNIALGGLFAFGVLFLFLRDPRNPILIGIAIPISIVATFVLCYFTGITLNIMTLGGLALGAGLLVDNSIVVLENIFRHRQEGMSPRQAATRGAEEVGMAVAAATFTTIAVFLPIAYVHGIAGELFEAQAWTVTFALLASLVVSLTVLPMLAARFLHVEIPEPAVEEAAAAGDRRWARLRSGPRRLLGWLLQPILTVMLFWVKLATRLVRWLAEPLLNAFGALYDAFARLYHGALVWCLNHKILTLIGLAGLVAWGVSVARLLPWELMPQVNTGRFEVTVDAPPGTPYTRLEGFVRALEAAARAGDGVESTFATLGADPGAVTAAAGSARLAPTRAQIAVVMAGTASRAGDDAVEAAQARVRAAAARLENVDIIVDPQSNPLQRLLGFGTRSFEVLIRGDDLDILEGFADEVGVRLRQVEGLEDVTSHTARGNPEIRLHVYRDVAASYGVTVQDVTRALRAALQGTVPTQFVEFDRHIDIRVMAQGDGGGVDAVLDQTYQTARGAVPLRQLVHYEITSGPREIQRRDRTRQIPVSASVSGIELSEAVATTESALASLDWPAGYRWAIGGDREEVEASFRSLGWALALAAALVYMVMAAQFESLVHPFVILFTLPLGWVGVVTGLWLAGLTINVVALIGAVVLTGIVVNDGIIKLDTINRLRRDGVPLRRAILEGSALRLRPILMTTVTTICALVPLALGLGAGAELQRPLAVAIIGGEFTGTLLTLVVLPVIYEILNPESSPAIPG